MRKTREFPASFYFLLSKEYYIKGTLLADEGDPEQPKVVPKKDWFTPVAGAQKKEE